MATLMIRTGQIFGTLIITEELGRNRVKCTCVQCYHSDVYRKQSVIKGTKCKGCTIQGIVKNRQGEVFRNLRVTEELGKGKVKCECIDCGAIDVYDRAVIINTKLRCIHCGIPQKQRKKSISKVEQAKLLEEVKKKISVGNVNGIIDGETYYHCRCKVCLKEMVGTASQLINHICSTPAMRDTKLNRQK